MAPTVPTRIPSTLTAGDTWRFTLAFADFPAGDGWVGTVSFRGASVLDASATADGDGHAFVIAASLTAPLEGGAVEYAVRMALSGAVYTADRGTCTILPDLNTADAGDRLSHEEKCIPLLETAIAARCAVDLKAYTVINSRQGTKEELRDMTRMLAQYRWIVRSRGTGGRRPALTFAFTRAS